MNSRYYRVLRKIFYQKPEGEIQASYDAAVNLHSLEASGNSFFQVIIQLYFMTLLVVFGTGTVIAGVDVVDFFKSVGKEETQFSLD